MLARIKFISSEDNRLNRDNWRRLEDFLGENVKANQMKINEEGSFESTSWRDTFDKEKSEKDKDFTLVTPADMYQLSDTNNFIVELEKFTSEFPSLEVTIKGLPKSVGNNNNDLIFQMNKVAEKIEDAKNRFEKVVEFNQKCEVHIPNLGLLNINKMAFATNYCTEALQQLLFQGWRIIAICPQPDQRRPDYILGMHVSNVEEEVSVMHFSGEGREGEFKEEVIC